MTDDGTRQPVLSTKDLCKSYPNGQVRALVDVNLEIDEGQYVAITGESGSGKSTLLNLLGGLDTPTAGEVLFRGKSLSQLDSLDRYRAMNIGFIFQSFHLMPTLSAVENVQVPMFGSGRSAAQRAVRAGELLEMVGLNKRLGHLPAELSVGERQRVAVARALANEPAVLLADEPTGNLDSKTATGILDLFEQLHCQSDLTLVVITHSEQLVQRARALIRLADGRVTEDRPVASDVGSLASETHDAGGRGAAQA